MTTDWDPAKSKCCKKCPTWWIYLKQCWEYYTAKIYISTERCESQVIVWTFAFFLLNWGLSFTASLFFVASLFSATAASPLWFLRSFSSSEVCFADTDAKITPVLFINIFRSLSVICDRLFSASLTNSRWTEDGCSRNRAFLKPNITGTPGIWMHTTKLSLLRTTVNKSKRELA